MINLNPKLYDNNIELKPIRDGFGEGLLLAGDYDKDVVALCADLKESTRVEEFAKKFPERFVEVGVAEQNLAVVASGLASMGKIPFAVSYAIFSPGRNWEQIRTAICYNNTNVKIVGSHAGLNVGADGGSHQMLEDIALARVIPRMIVVVPCDALEAKKATLALVDIICPAYLRLAREKSPVVTSVTTPFEIGRAEIFRESKRAQAVIIACGLMVHRAMMASKKLAKEGIEVTVINNHTIKPLDGKTILAEVEKTGAVVVAEEHQKAGGLGSAVAEFLAQNYPVPMEFIGVDDKFGESGGSAELLEHFGLGVDDIIEAVKKVIDRK